MVMMHKHGELAEFDMAELEPLMVKKIVTFAADVQELAEFTVVGSGRRGGKQLKVSAAWAVVMIACGGEAWR